MKRFVEEFAVIAACAMLIPFSDPDTISLVALLCAILLACVCRLVERAAVWPVAVACIIAYLAAASFSMSFLLFVPLCAYLSPFAFSRFSRGNVLHVLLLLPLCITFARVGLCVEIAAVFGIGALAFLLSCTSVAIAEEKKRIVAEHDETEEARIELARLNRDLVEQREYETRLAALNERGRIAREIHDNVGHLLTRSILQVEAMLVTQGEEDALREPLGDIRATLKDALASVRASVHDLHDDSLDLHAELCSIANAQSSLQVSVEYDVQYVPLNVSYAMLAIAKESVSNAVRHSDATSMRISIFEYPAFFQMKVCDNGTSTKIDSAPSVSSASEPGMGLQAMRERVESLGGRIEFGKDAGFGIFIVIPKAGSLSSADMVDAAKTKKVAGRGGEG